MKTTIIIAVLATLALSVYGNMLPHDGDLVASEPPRYRLDLNVEPQHRWDHIIPDFKHIIQDLNDKVMSQLPVTDAELIAFGAVLNKYYKYQEYLEEMKGIGKASGVLWEKIFIANFFYEFSTLGMCTSILAKDKDNKILLGRNLDFPLWEYLSKLSAKVEVYKGDKYIGVWDQLIGGVIVLSGQNPQDIALTVDTRFYHDSWLDIIDNVFIKQYYPSAYVARFVLEQGLNYEDTQQMLMDTDVTSPIYYILAGTDDGIIIEKQPVGVHAYHNFSETNPDSWFMVETNYDWNEDPADDDRKTPAVERMNEIGQANINKDNMFDLLMKWPSLNLHTIYTVIFSPELEYNDISLWYGNNQSPLPEGEISLESSPSFDLEKELERFTEFVEFITAPEFLQLMKQEVEPIY